MTDEICCGSSFGTFEEQDKVLVALSGGVDSSVCIQILRDQGFDVQAVVIRFSPAHDAAVRAAQTVARQLGVPLIEEDCTEEFEQQVVEPFCAQYCAGRTPSPCVAVQSPRQISQRWPVRPTRLGIRYIANRALRPRDGGGRRFTYVRAAVSAGARPELHAVWACPRIFWPACACLLGEFEKVGYPRDGRQSCAACQRGCAGQPGDLLHSGRRLCRLYRRTRPRSTLQGRFIGPDGEDLGPHKGVWHYTVGPAQGP